MAKRRVIQNRRQTRSVKSKGGSNSAYAKKLAAQKRGIFSPRSPFSLGDGQGIELSRFNRIRSVFTSARMLNGRTASRLQLEI